MIVNFYDGNTQMLTLQGLASGGDDTTGPLVYVDNANVTATLMDPNWFPVTGFNNLTMTYVPGSEGWYQCIIPSSLQALTKQRYTLVIDADTGAGHLHREYPATVSNASL